MSDFDKALLDAKKKIPTIAKNAEGQVGPRRYRYADLSAVLESVEPVLLDAGFVLVHTIEDEVLVTTLRHSVHNGELATKMPLDFSLTAQQLGAVLTYFRRYAIASLLSLNIDDDVDGSVGEEKPKAPPKQKPKPAPKKPAPKTSNGSGPQPAALADGWLDVEVPGKSFTGHTWGDLVSHGTKDGKAHKALRWFADKADDPTNRARGIEALRMLEERLAQTPELPVEGSGPE